MKRLLTIIALTMAVSANAQRGASLTTVSNFSVDNKSMVYEHIFNRDGLSSNHKDALITMMKRNKIFTDIVEDSVEISAKIYHWHIDFVKFGGITEPGTLPGKGFEGFWDADILIQLKDQKYRVIVSSLVEDEGVRTSGTALAYHGIASGATNSKQAILDFSDWVMNKERTAVKNNRVNNVVVMSNALNDLFEIRAKQSSIANKEW